MSSINVNAAKQVQYYAVLKGLKKLSVSTSPATATTGPTATGPSTSAPPTKQAPQKKPMQTLYWAIKLDLAAVLETVEHVFETSPQLVANQEVHSTLLFVGRKPNADEEKLLPYNNKCCKIMVDGYGLSDNALCLRVASMLFNDTLDPVPSFQTVTQHVTVALSKGTKAVDSVKAMSNMFVHFVSPVSLDGVITRYFF